MKSLKPLYFVVGMTGMFSMTVPSQPEWLASMPVIPACALTVALSLALAATLTWLTQFRRRHIGSPGLLVSFAACGLLVTAQLPVRALELMPDPIDGMLATALRLALFALFCLVAVETQPASEYTEGTA
jgi:hypothetical protein